MLFAALQQLFRAWQHSFHSVGLSLDVCVGLVENLDELFSKRFCKQRHLVYCTPHQLMMVSPTIHQIDDLIERPTGTIFGSVGEVSGCAWSRNLDLNLCPAQGLSLGPGSLMAVNVTTRLPHTPFIWCYRSQQRSVCFISYWGILPTNVKFKHINTFIKNVFLMRSLGFPYEKFGIFFWVVWDFLLRSFGCPYEEFWVFFWGERNSKLNKFFKSGYWNPAKILFPCLERTSNSSSTTLHHTPVGHTAMLQKSRNWTGRQVTRNCSLSLHIYCFSFEDWLLHPCFISLGRRNILSLLSNQVLWWRQQRVLGAHAMHSAEHTHSGF